MPEVELAGRVAVVTGANQGIGAAVAVALAARGAAVLVTYLRLDPAEHADDPAFPDRYGRDRAVDGAGVVERIRGAGGRAEALEADLADPVVPAVVFDRAEAVFGPVSVLVNNASGWLADSFRAEASDRLGRRLGRVDAAGFDRQFAVDARAPALLIGEFARRHRARGGDWGRIVGLTSGGSGGFPGEVSYGAAKAAQENYTMSAAQELAEYGVTANMVYPPITDTGWVTPAVVEVAARAGRRVAEPADVAEVVALLMSDRARHLTGQVLRMS